MSELTRCNRCTLNDIIRRAGKGAEIRLVSGEWTVCYVNGERVASFLELTEQCAC